jgi:hypothetical protein
MEDVWEIAGKVAATLGGDHYRPSDDHPGYFGVAAGPHEQALAQQDPPATVTAFPSERVVRAPPDQVAHHTKALLRGQLMRLLADVDAGRIVQMVCVFERPGGLWEDAMTMRVDSYVALAGALEIAKCRVVAAQLVASTPIPPPGPA